MVVGCYKANGEVLVLPLKELAGRIGLTEDAIKRALAEKNVYPTWCLSSCLPVRRLGDKDRRMPT